jgi:large subunit ribosomal protein L33
MAEKTRHIITLACSVCKERNYHNAVGKKRDKKIELKKYCPRCKKHTLHKEVK